MKRPPDFHDLETPITPFRGLRFDPDARTYHREPVPTEPEPAERPGAART